MTLNKINTIFFVTLVVFVTAYLYLSLVPLDLSKYTSHIEKSFEDHIDGKMSIESAQMYPLPYPRIKAANISFESNSEKVIKAKSININIALFPLLFKKIVVKSLKLVDANILIKRDKDGNINLQPKPSTKKNDKSGNFLFSLKSFHTVNSSILLIDNMSEPTQSHAFNNLDLNLYPLPDGFNYTGKGIIDKVTKFNFSGTGSEKNNITTLTGIIDARNINLDKYRQLIEDNTAGIVAKGTAHLESSYSFDITDFYHSTGIINGNIAYTDLDISIPSLFKNVFQSKTGSANLDVTWEKDKLNITVDNIALNLPEFTMTGGFSLHKRGLIKDFSLKLDTSSAPYQYLKGFIPLRGIPKGVQNVIDQIKPTSGEFTINNFFLSMVLGEKGKTKPKLNNIMIDGGFDNFVFKYDLFNNKPALINGNIILNISPYKIDRETDRIFKKVDVDFNNVTGFIENSVIELSGRIEDTIDMRPEFNFTGEATLTHSALTNLFSRAHLETFKYNKHAKFKGSLTGPMDRLTLKSNIDLTNTDIGLPGPFRKNKGIPLKLKSIAVFEPEGITLEEGILIAGESHITTGGRLGIKDGKSFIELRSDKLLVQDAVTLIEAIEDDFPSSGTITMDIRSVKESKDSEPTFDGKLTIEEGLFKPLKNIYPISDLNVRVTLEEKTGKALIESVQIGEKTKLSGQVDLINTARGLINFNFISNFFDLEDLMIHSDDVLEEHKETGAERFDSESFFTGKGKLSIREGNFLGLTFNNFSTDIVMHKDAVNLNPLNLVSNDGIITGDLIFYRKQNTKKLFDTRLNLRLADLDMLFKDFGAKDRILSGKVEGTMELYAKPVKKGEPLTKGLNGSLKFHSENGKLWKFNVVAKIFSFANISLEDMFGKGLTYNDIRGKFAIKDGIMTPSHFFFDSSSMRMTAVGEIDIPNKSIDSKIGVHPFVKLDMIISNIPFAGWIITGPDGSTVSMYYEITGPIGDPKVDAIPVKALEEGVGNFFKRILESPVKTLESLTGEDY